ncbi:MAG TPA: hypothetical protein VF411_00415 [Bacteroidia bacterium]
MIKRIIAISCAAALMSCGSNKTENSSENKTAEVKDTAKKAPETSPTNELAEFKFTTLVINIPSPFEIVGILPKVGIPFNAELLNPVDKVSKYTTSTKKGLNYGAYVVDLVYLSTNQQFAQLKSYFKTSRDLAQSLDCLESFDKVAGKRLEKNMDKADTINKVMDQLYGEMDSYLRSNDRLLTATQILIGSWVESQYLTTSLLKNEAKNDKNQLLFTKVNEQRNSLAKLVDLLKEYEKEKELKPTIDGLKDLNKLYNDLKVGTSDIDKALLEKIQAKLSLIRGKITG